MGFCHPQSRTVSARLRLMFALALCLFGPSIGRAAGEATEEFHRVQMPLPSPTDHVVAGAGGKLLLMHIPDRQEIDVFDVTTRKFVQTISTPDEHVQFAAGLEKLVIILPDKGIIQRWDLTKFRKELTVPLPQGAPIGSIAMGYASSGPAIIAQPSGPMFLDLQTLRPRKVSYDSTFRYWSPDRDARNKMRTSPDGSTVAAWMSYVTLISLQHDIASMRWIPDTVQSISPSADDQKLFTSSGVYRFDTDYLGLSGLRGLYCVPSYKPSLFLAIQMQHGPMQGEFFPFQASIYAAYYEAPLLTLPQFEEMRQPLGIRRIPVPASPLALAERVHYFPDANLMLTIPPSGNEVVLRDFNLITQMDRLGLDYLFADSVPPGTAARPGIYQYDLKVRSRRGGMRFSLRQAPPGMELSKTGQLRWNVSESLAVHQARVVIDIKDDSGQSVSQGFVIRILD